MPSKFTDSKRVGYHTDSKTLVCEVERKSDVYVLHMVNEDNRLRPDTITSLIAALDDIENDFKKLRKEAKSNGADAPLGSLITTGQQHIYSNGLDFSLLMSGKLGTIDFFENYYHKLCLRVMHMPFPTAAAINGHAFAGGLMLAFSHDYRIMRSDRGYLCMPEVDLPGALTPGMMSIVRNSVPNYNVFRDVMLQGKRFNGDEALKYGMVDMVVPNADELLSAAISLANKWAPKALKSPLIYKQLRLEMRGDVVDALKNGGLGFIPKL